MLRLEKACCKPLPRACLPRVQHLAVALSAPQLDCVALPARSPQLPAVSVNAGHGFCGSTWIPLQVYF